MSFHNGLLQVAEARRIEFHTRSEENQTKPWIDHVLHKGSSAFVSICAAFVRDGVEWKGLSDLCPLIAVFRVHNTAQTITKKTIQEQIRFELDVNEKRM